MKNGRRKFNAMFLAMCMVVTAFVAVVGLPVMANENSADFEIFWVDSWMEDDPDVIPADELIVFNFDDNNLQPYYLGDENAEIELLIYNRNGAALTDDLYITLAKGTGGTSIIADIPVARWPASGDYDGYLDDDPIDDDPGDLDYIGDNLPTFEIDIATSGAVNTVYTNALTITINYATTTDTFSFDLYVSSIFDYFVWWDDDSIDTHEDLPNILETDALPGYFEDNEDMQEGQIWLNQYLPNTVSDVETTLDLSGIGADIEAQDGQTIAKNPTGGWGFAIYYRLDVGTPLPDPRTPVPPGIYTGGDLQIQYVRDDTGETITENARPIGLTVGYTPRVTAELQSAVSINQGDTSADFNVRFTNDGNVDLSNLWIWSDEPDPWGDWWDVSFHHYENDDDTYEPQVEVGDLASGAQSGWIPTRVAADPRAPNGTHRLPFQWNGWYYEDGSTGEATSWVEVGGYMWDHDSDPSTPMVGRLYEDANENMRYDGGEQIEDVWTGSYVDIAVIDQNGLSFEAYLAWTLNAGDYGDITNTQIEVVLLNNELVSYTNVECRLAVGPGTPFFDPADHSATTLDMDPSALTTIGPWPSTLDIYFTVDINAAWWQTNSVAPGVYWVDMYVDATNEDEEIRYTDNTVPIKVGIDGFGPELYATVVSYTKITPGEKFTLTVTIANYGDDTARDVCAYLSADFVSGWDVLDQFITSISSYGHNKDYDTWNRSNDIKPGDVGVDSVPQIVELYDWIKRRETPPQGIILGMHLDSLEPGSEYSFVFEMQSDVNMVEGMAYYETLELEYVDSNGETYGPGGPTAGYNHTSESQQVLIRTGKGTKYTGEEMDWSVLLYVIIFVIIAFILLIIGYALGGRERKGEAKPRERFYYEEPEEEIGPPEPEEIGPPEPEEEIGPPLPEEKPPE